MVSNACAVGICSDCTFAPKGHAEHGWRDHVFGLRQVWDSVSVILISKQAEALF